MYFVQVCGNSAGPSDQGYVLLRWLNPYGPLPGERWVPHSEKSYNCICKNWQNSSPLPTQSLSYLGAEMNSAGMPAKLSTARLNVFKLLLSQITPHRVVTVLWSDVSVQYDVSKPCCHPLETPPHGERSRLVGSIQFDIRDKCWTSLPHCSQI